MLTTFSSSINTCPEVFSDCLVLKSIVMSFYLLALKNKVRWEVGAILCAFVSKASFFNVYFFQVASIPININPIYYE